MGRDWVSKVDHKPKKNSGLTVNDWFLGLIFKSQFQSSPTAIRIHERIQVTSIRNERMEIFEKIILVCAVSHISDLNTK